MAGESSGSASCCAGRCRASGERGTLIFKSSYYESQQVIRRHYVSIQHPDGFHGLWRGRAGSRVAAFAGVVQRLRVRPRVQGARRVHCVGCALLLIVQGATKRPWWLTEESPRPCFVRLPRAFAGQGPGPACIASEVRRAVAGGVRFLRRATLCLARRVLRSQLVAMSLSPTLCEKGVIFAQGVLAVCLSRPIKNHGREQ